MSPIRRLVSSILSWSRPVALALASSGWAPRAAAVAVAGLVVLAPAVARADTPENFVRTGHAQLDSLLRQAPSAGREARIAAIFGKIIDYDELIRRCFKEHWTQLSADQRSEVAGLLKQLVEKNYQKNLKRTLDYTITYTGSRAQGSDVRVRTQAKSKLNAREPVVQVDYIVAGPAGGPYHVVDIVTEGSSLTKNYYSQFHRMLNTQSEGYPYIVRKLRAKIAKLDKQ